MLFKDNAFAHLNYLRRLQKQLQKKIETMPKGTVFRKISKGTPYYYERKDGQVTSLQKNPQLLAQYQTKDRLTKTLSLVSDNIACLENFLKDYRSLTTTNIDFASYEAEQNPGWSEEKRTLYKGTYYRSKSEAMIAAMLTSYNIPFKYEIKYQLNGRKIYPDFFIERPKDKKVFFWEHFGKIDDENYINKTFYKLQDYHNAGIDLWDNLIATFDQSDGGINADHIDKIINLYLL